MAVSATGEEGSGGIALTPSGAAALPRSSAASDPWQKCTGITFLVVSLIILGGLITANSLALNGDLSLQAIGIINLPVIAIAMLLVCAAGDGGAWVFFVAPLVTCILAIMGLSSMEWATLPALGVVCLTTIVALWALGTEVRACIG